MIPDARAYYQEGVCDAQAGNYEAAEYHLLKSLEIDPANSTYATLGWMYGSILKRETDAFRCFRNAIRMQPENGDHYNDFGALLLKTNFNGANLNCTDFSNAYLQSADYEAGRDV